MTIIKEYSPWLSWLSLYKVLYLAREKKDDVIVRKEMGSGQKRSCKNLEYNLIVFLEYSHLIHGLLNFNAINKRNAYLKY